MSKFAYLDDEIEETEEQLKKSVITDCHNTVVNKYKYIHEIKNGLGADIRKNPSKVKIIKKTWSQKLGLFFKKIFTKF